MRSSRLRFQTALLGGLAVLAGASQANAAVVTADADTFVVATQVGSPIPTGTTTAGFISLRDNATVANRRMGAIRFLPDPLDVGVSDGSSLSLTFQTTNPLEAGDAVDIFLYGALDGSSEDDLVEANYTPQAINGGGNNIDENFIFNGGDPSLRLLDTVSFTTTPAIDSTITFAGSLLDDFVTSVTNSATDSDLAFVLTLRSTDSNGDINNYEAKFDSQNLAGGSAPLLNVNVVSAIPEPSAAALVGIGLVGVSVRRRRRRI